MSRLPLVPRRDTFLGLPAAALPVAGAATLFGAVHGTPYRADPAEGAAGETGPDAVRRAITAACLDIGHWDFDFDGPLLADGDMPAFDLGDVETVPGDAAGNRANIEAVTRAVSRRAGRRS